MIPSKISRTLRTTSQPTVWVRTRYDPERCPQHAHGVRGAAIPLLASAFGQGRSAETYTVATLFIYSSVASESVPFRIHPSPEFFTQVADTRARRRTTSRARAPALAGRVRDFRLLSGTSSCGGRVRTSEPAVLVFFPFRPRHLFF